MVLKLIKNELVDSRSRILRVLLAIVFVALLMAGINYSSDLNTNNPVVSLLSGLMAFGLIAMMIAAFVILPIFAYFDLLYNSIYGKRAYKLFTLPVKTWEILVSKIVVAIIWGILITVTSIIAMIFFITVTTWELQSITKQIFDFLAFVARSMTVNGVFAVLLEGIADTLLKLVMFLFAGAIVNTGWFQNRRKIWLFVVYILILFLVGKLLGLFDTNAFYLNINEVELEGIISGASMFSWDRLFDVFVDASGLARLTLVGVLKLLLTGVLSYATIWLWDHKLEIIE